MPLGSHYSWGYPLLGCLPKTCYLVEENDCQWVNQCICEGIHCIDLTTTTICCGYGLLGIMAMVSLFWLLDT